MINIQPIEKRGSGSPDLLDVHSIFETIQGEGPFTGVPCVFIRLAGCNLQCPKCDTDYTSNRTTTTPAAILVEVKALRSQGLVVITGGEPLRQNLDILIKDLLVGQYYVQIETNGTLEPPAIAVRRYSLMPSAKMGVYIVCSPKSGKINPVTEKCACCYKYVLSADSVHEDGLPVSVLGNGVRTKVARPKYPRPVYLQPADPKDDVQYKKNVNAVIDSCMAHGYTLQLQTHKILNIE